MIIPTGDLDTDDHPSWMRRIAGLLLRLSVLVVSFLIVIFILILLFESKKIDALKIIDYEPDLVTRLYDKDAKPLSELSWERRLYVPLNEIPKTIQNAFIAAEDRHFYQHPGIDLTGLARAVIENTFKNSWEKRPAGASTITQQVVKNIIVGNAPSLQRKISEAIISFHVENTLDKERILEIYLNEIYLGSKSYGVYAAAQTYFSKSIDDLTIAEAAYLA
ncbi:MAG: transglycosylase domain-containing protein, partial [Alphaproteobacteria bacterium]|nr:transglycosylase domain-containing protein [Alphaproteobacteria bacterium]